MIPEVCIYFDRKLIRGNRASKVAADRFRAFDSPNLKPLVEMEVEEQVIYHHRVHAIMGTAKCPSTQALLGSKLISKS